MRGYREMREAAAAQSESDAQSSLAGDARQPAWKAALKICGFCCLCVVVTCLLFVGLAVAIGQSSQGSSAPARTDDVAAAESLPPAAMEVMARQVPQKTKNKVSKIAASLEASLANPQMPEGMTMSRGELKRAAELVRDGVSRDGTVISAFQDVQAAASMSLTVSAAASHDMLLSDEDVKELSGGAPGIMEGEEYIDSLESKLRELGEATDPASAAGATPGRLRRLSESKVAGGRPWADGVVNYCFARDLPERTKGFFRLAADAWMKAAPCLTFVEVGWKSGNQADVASEGRACQETPAIFVGDDGSGCWSHLGMTGGTQAMSLANPGCIWIGTAEHEIGHALGMDHEQCRTDRDGYITVQWQNIPDDQMKAQFDINDRAFADIEYDYLSVMHYGQWSSTQPWFTVPDGVDITQVGQRSTLSDGDIAQLVAMYEPEVDGCRGGGGIITGCIDTPGSHCDRLSGGDSCDAASSDERDHCCACGGGVEVKCYKRTDCPNVTASWIDHLVDLIPGEKPSWLTGSQVGALLGPLLFALLGLLACTCCCFCVAACVCPALVL